MSVIPLGMKIQPMDLSGVVSELYHSFMYFYTFLSKVIKSCALFLWFCLNVLMKVHRQLESFRKCCGYIYNMCLDLKFIDQCVKYFSLDKWCNCACVIHINAYYCFSEHWIVCYIWSHLGFALNVPNERKCGNTVGGACSGLWELSSQSRLGVSRGRP